MDEAVFHKFKLETFEQKQSFDDLSNGETSFRAIGTMEKITPEETITGVGMLAFVCK